MKTGIDGFEVRLDKEDDRSLYITNRLASGKISIIVGEERPSVADIKNEAMRWDVPNDQFADLWRRVDFKLKKTADVFRVSEIEVPEVAVPVERKVKPRGRRKKVTAE